MVRKLKVRIKRRRRRTIRGTRGGRTSLLLPTVSLESRWKRKGRKRGRGGPDPVSWGHTTGPSTCAFPVALELIETQFPSLNFSPKSPSEYLREIQNIIYKILEGRNKEKQFSANDNSTQILHTATIIMTC
jgi:hypothetical protein